MTELFESKTCAECGREMLFSARQARPCMRKGDGVETETDRQLSLDAPKSHDQIRTTERLRCTAELERLAALCPDPNSNDAMIIKGCAAALRGM